MARWRRRCRGDRSKWTSMRPPFAEGGNQPIMAPNFPSQGARRASMRPPFAEGGNREVVRKVRMAILYRTSMRPPFAEGGNADTS